GSKSGNHDFDLVLCDDGKTINLNPIIYFAYDEMVEVTIAEGMKTAAGETVGSYQFNFTTHRKYSAKELQQFSHLQKDLLEEEWKSNGYQPEKNSSAIRDVTGLFTLPVNTNPTPGEIF